MKKTDLDSFASFTKRMFETIAININNLQLNGSFNNSYWASDIDLYEKVSSLKKVQQKLKQLAQHKHKDLQLMEVKVQYTTGDKNKHTSSFSSITLKGDVSFVKLDLVSFHYCFPIDVSIIYDVNSETMSKKEVVQALLDDIQYKLRDNLYKAVKRVSSISEIMGKPYDFAIITEDTKSGLLYLCINRLDVLHRIKDLTTRTQYNYWMDMIKDDLRRYNLTLSDDLQGELNKRVVSLSSKLLS